MVDWLYHHVEGFGDRREARKYASGLLKAGLIRHTVNKITFSEQCYYVFGDLRRCDSCEPLPQDPLDLPVPMGPPKTPSHLRIPPKTPLCPQAPPRPWEPPPQVHPATLRDPLRDPLCTQGPPRPLLSPDTAPKGPPQSALIPLGTPCTHRRPLRLPHTHGTPALTRPPAHRTRMPGFSRR